MTPVCPACRTPLALEAHACWRCGLNVRPTCANCAEPLMHGMSSCWYCGETIEQAPEVRETQLHRAAVAAPPAADRAPAHATDTAPVATVRAAAPPRPVPARPQGFSAGRAVFGGIMAGLLLTAGMLALEAAMPRYTSTTPVTGELVERAFADLGFRIAHPSGWRISENGGGVSFLSGETAAGRSTRGFSLEALDLPFDRVGSEAPRLNRRRAADYTAVSATTGDLAGREAHTFHFTGDGLRMQQWWIDGRDGTVRLEFWSRLADEDAVAVNTRIARTLEAL